MPSEARQSSSRSRRTYPSVPRDVPPLFPCGLCGGQEKRFHLGAGEETTTEEQAEEVRLGQDAHEVVVLDDRHRANLSLGHQPDGDGERLVGASGQRRRRHDVSDTLPLQRLVDIHDLVGSTAGEDSEQKTTKVTVRQDTFDLTALVDYRKMVDRAAPHPQRSLVAGVAGLDGHYDRLHHLTHLHVSLTCSPAP